MANSVYFKTAQSAELEGVVQVLHDEPFDHLRVLIQNGLPFIVKIPILEGQIEHDWSARTTEAGSRRYAEI